MHAQYVKLQELWMSPIINNNCVIMQLQKGHSHLRSYTKSLHFEVNDTLGSSSYNDDVMHFHAANKL